MYNQPKGRGKTSLHCPRVMSKVSINKVYHSKGPYQKVSNQKFVITKETLRVRSEYPYLKTIAMLTEIERIKRTNNTLLQKSTHDGISY